MRKQVTTFIVFLCFFSSTALAAEKKFTWIYFLGGATPVTAGEGDSTPIVLIRYQNQADHRNHFQFKTNQLTFQNSLNESMAPRHR